VAVLVAVNAVKKTTTMSTKHDKPELFLAFNTKVKPQTVTVLEGFKTWEEVQMASRVGIELPNGVIATGIGRALCAVDELEAQVAKPGSGTVMLRYAAPRGWESVEGGAR